jgi:hypothetical protein
VRRMVPSGRQGRLGRADHQLKCPTTMVPTFGPARSVAARGLSTDKVAVKLDSILHNPQIRECR